MINTIKDKDGNATGYYYAQYQQEPTDAVLSDVANRGCCKQPHQIEPNPQQDGRVFNTPPMFRYPSTTDELIEYAQDFFQGCKDIALERNKRYAGAFDPFKNFRLGGDYGIAIRMGDKVSRLLTLLHPSNTVDDDGESIEDNCRDLVNYSMLLSAFRRNERGR
jgi:hypothetical protein